MIPAKTEQLSFTFCSNSRSTKWQIGKLPEAVQLLGTAGMMNYVTKTKLCPEIKAGIMKMHDGKTECFTFLASI